MARYAVREPVVDTLSGAAIPNVSVTVYNSGTTTPIGQTIYSTPTGGGTRTNPFTTGADGYILFYLDTPLRVDLLVSAAGYAPRTIVAVDPTFDPSHLVNTDSAQTIGGVKEFDGTVNITGALNLSGTLTATGITLASPTITGGTISGATLTGTTITANSLALSGTLDVAGATHLTGGTSGGNHGGLHVFSDGSAGMADAGDNPGNIFTVYKLYSASGSIDAGDGTVALTGMEPLHSEIVATGHLNDLGTFRAKFLQGGAGDPQNGWSQARAATIVAIRPRTLDTPSQTEMDAGTWFNDAAKPSWVPSGFLTSHAFMEGTHGMDLSVATAVSHSGYQFVNVATTAYVTHTGRGTLPQAGPYYQQIWRTTDAGVPNGGQFKLTYSGQQTGDLNWNATWQEVETALIALSNIGPDDVRCSGGPLPTYPIYVNFQHLLKANTTMLTVQQGTVSLNLNPPGTVFTYSARSTWHVGRKGNSYFFCQGEDNAEFLMYWIGGYDTTGGALDRPFISIAEPGWIGQFIPKASYPLHLRQPYGTWRQPVLDATPEHQLAIPGAAPTRPEFNPDGTGQSQKPTVTTMAWFECDFPTPNVPATQLVLSGRPTSADSGAGTARKLMVGFNTASQFGSIAAETDGGAKAPVAINPTGGPVLVGGIAASGTEALHAYAVTNNATAAIFEGNNGDNPPDQVVIRGASNTAQNLLIGYRTDTDVGVIQANLAGTGPKPLDLNPLQAGGLRIAGTTSGARFQADFSTGSDSAPSTRAMFQTNMAANNNTVVSLVPSGSTSTSTRLVLYDKEDIANAGWTRLFMQNTLFQIGTQANGSGTIPAVAISPNNFEAFRADYNGSVARVSFFAGTPAIKQTINGNKGGNAALASVIALLVAYNLAIDSSGP